MDRITFQNQEFKTREIELPKFGQVLLSTISLNQLLMKKNGGYTSDLAETLDEKIFFYVEDSEIDLSETELINVINSEIIW